MTDGKERVSWVKVGFVLFVIVAMLGTLFSALAAQHDAEPPRGPPVNPGAPAWANNSQINRTEITRLESYYQLYWNLTKPVLRNVTSRSPLINGSVNFGVFPDFPDWNCAAYRGQGELECNIDRCQAIMQTLNLTVAQSHALCGANWRARGLQRIQ